MNKLAPTIAAIVFDSGGVLLKHRHAFLDPSAVTEALCELSIGVGEQRVVQAVRAALDWFSGQAGSVTTEETAAAERMEYYRRLLAGAGAAASPERMARLRHRLEGPESVEPFPEVREVLDALRARNLKLGVLSDGWASTIQLYERLGLAGFFQSWTFSAVVGCCKPDPRIYVVAERSVGVEPACVLFVDDLPANVAGALRCGWQALWLNRAGDQPAIHPSRTIRDLRELMSRYGASFNT